MKPSEEKTRNILCLDEPGGDINYSVVAGAGAGKSTMLSKRISRQIKNGEKLGSFVIITYTNAAANELRDKISDELTKILADPKLSLDEQNYVKNALEKIELIQISTIHAFLLQILREYAFESNLALDTKMYEEDEESERRKVFFDKWIKTHFDDLDTFRSDWSIKNDKDFVTDYTRNVLWNMFNDISSVREDIVFDVTDHSDDFEKVAKKYVDDNLPTFEQFKDEILCYRPCKKSGEKKDLNKGPQTIVDNINTVEGNIGLGEYGIEDAKMISQAYAALIERIKAKEKDPNQSFYGKNFDDSELHFPNVPKDEIEWNFEIYYDNYMSWAQKANKIVEYAIKIKSEYQKEIDSDAKGISNDDILYRSEMLLEKHPDILKKLREKYSKIYVDEFQDTTGCQARIIKLLSGKDGSDLKAFDPKNNNLMVVGDPKQSIYRFTGAEKAIYDKVNNEINDLDKTLGQVAMLDSNFRSNKDIVDWVNGKYTNLMPNYNAMDSDWIVKEKNAFHGVFKYEIEESSDNKKYCREDDSKAVASIIKNLVSNDKCFIEEYNRKDNSCTLRKVRFSDFMVITKRATKMADYIKEFNEEDIPVNIQGKFKLEDDEIVRNFIRVLNYFANTKNKNICFAASQIAGRTDATKDDDKGIEFGKEKLKKLKNVFISEKLNTAAIVHRLLKEESLYLPDGNFDVLRVKEYKSRLNQMVETCLTNNDGDIAELIKTMLLYIDKDIKKANSLETGIDAVRLMNVHQSKGLTGNIVIIADRSNEEGPRYSGFKSDGKYYPAASYSPSLSSSPIVHPAFAYDDSLMKKASKEEWEESTRLEYVAATRAAHALIFMPVIGNAKNVWFSDPEYKIDFLPGIMQWISERVNDASNYDIKTDANVIEKTLKLSNLEENIKNCVYVNSPVIDSINPSNLEPAESTGYCSNELQYAKEADRPHGNVFGTVMHRTYELIFSQFDSLNKLGEKDRKSSIKRIVNQAILEQKDEMNANDNPDEFSLYLNSKMLYYFNKVVVPIMNNAEEVYPEYSFSFFVPKEEVDDFKTKFQGFLQNSVSKKTISTDNIWINGQADLVVRQKDGKIKIYDYKSDAMNGKPLIDFESSLQTKYKGQLELYKYAIKKTFEVDEENILVEIIHLYR